MQRLFPDTQGVNYFYLTVAIKTQFVFVVLFSLVHAQNLLGVVEKMTSDACFCMVGPYATLMCQEKTQSICIWWYGHQIGLVLPRLSCPAPRDFHLCLCHRPGEHMLVVLCWRPERHLLVDPYWSLGPHLLLVPSWCFACVAAISRPKLLQPDVSGQGQLNSQAAAASNFWPWATSCSWAAAVTSCCAAAIPRPCAAETCCSWACSTLDHPCHSCHQFLSCGSPQFLC